MAINNLIGYPTRVSNKIKQVFDWTAPNPYVVGGVTLRASDFAMGGFDCGHGAVSQSGTYNAVPRFSTSGANSTVKIMVFVVATGLQAAAIDLSAEKFRIELEGE